MKMKGRTDGTFVDYVEAFGTRLIPGGEAGSAAQVSGLDEDPALVAADPKVKHGSGFTWRRVLLQKHKHLPSVMGRRAASAFPPSRRLRRIMSPQTKEKTSRSSKNRSFTPLTPPETT